MIEHFGNQLEEESQDPLVLDTKGITLPGAVDALCHAHEVSHLQFNNFMERTKPIGDAIHRNKLKIFGQLALKPSRKGNQLMKWRGPFLSSVYRVPEPRWEYR